LEVHVIRSPIIHKEKVREKAKKIFESILLLDFKKTKEARNSVKNIGIK